MGRAVPLKWAAQSRFENGPNRLGRGIPGRNGFGPRSPGTLKDVFVHLLQQWYSEQMKMLCDWLTDRLDLSLHPYQLTCIMAINRVGVYYFKLYRLTEDELFLSIHISNLSLSHLEHGIF